VPRRQLVDPAHGGPVTGHVLEREIGVDRLEIDVASNSRQPQQRLQLGRKGERAVGEPRPQQRLLAEAVARQHQPFAARIPECQCEHPAHSLDEAGSALLV
jgi:hypothetical protein